MAMTLRLADDETEALRRRADLEHRSMQEAARQAIGGYVENHSRALIDGSKRLAPAAVTAFYGLNGRRLTLTSDAACDLVVNVAAGHLDSVDAIAAILQTATQPRKQDKTVHRAASGTPGYLA